MNAFWDVPPDLIEWARNSITDEEIEDMTKAAIDGTGVELREFLPELQNPADRNR